MIISNKLSDRDRHYINNLIVSGRGELPDKNGNVSDKATHRLEVEKGFIIGAVKILRKEVKK
jgi:hypothetical protein